MKDIPLLILLWPIHRLREVLALRRFDTLARAATHKEMRPHDEEGISLLPGGMMIPWAAIVEARWYSKLVSGMEPYETHVVVLRTSDGSTKIIGPTSEASHPGNLAAMKSLEERGVLPPTPRPGGQTAGMGTFFLDIVWLFGVALVVLVVFLISRC